MRRQRTLGQKRRKPVLPQRGLRAGSKDRRDGVCGAPACAGAPVGLSGLRVRMRRCRASSLKWSRTHAQVQVFSRLGASWVHVGPTGGHLGPPGSARTHAQLQGWFHHAVALTYALACVCPSWVFLGSCWLVWRPSWPMLGPGRGCLGPCWGRVRTILLPSGSRLRPCWGQLGARGGHLGAIFGP